MDKDLDLALPTVPEGEFPRKHLISPYSSAFRDLLKASKSLRAAAPVPYHYRDQGEEVFVKACVEHARRVHRLDVIREEIHFIYKNIPLR